MSFLPLEDGVVLPIVLKLLLQNIFQGSPGRRNMPTVAVSKSSLLKDLERTEITDEQFDELCFEFGLELDDVYQDEEGNIMYKLEIPANRYDMLCLEGISAALKAFIHNTDNEMNSKNKNENQNGENLEKESNDFNSQPSFLPIPQKGSIKLTVRESVSSIRPYAVGAILRGITFTSESYQSFIDLQDKLHMGLGRRRAIVSMGTHDLDTLTPPFFYDAKSPDSFHFKPLNKDQMVNGMELLKLYENDLKIKKYLHLIKDSPLFPLILDSKGTIGSLPPIINSDHSKISLNTKNVFIDVTATDLNKAKIALNMICISFGKYCNSIEMIETIYPDGTSIWTPDFKSRNEIISVSYINSMLGLNLDSREMCKLLKRMMIPAIPLKTSSLEILKNDNDKEKSEGEKNLADSSSLNREMIQVTIGSHRSDILHACDIMEDVAIAYGFNKLPQKFAQTSTIGSPLALNKLTDGLRQEVAMCGFDEICTFTLCSHNENFSMLNKEDNGREAVVLANPKTIEFEVVQTSLAPQLLKTLAANKKMPLPIRIFEILDVVLLDSKHQNGARNERHLGALTCDMVSGFEIMHGLLDRIMVKLGINSCDYKIEPSTLGLYFPGRQAQIVYRNDIVIGSFGIIHPMVMANFDAPYVASMLEINIEPFL